MHEAAELERVLSSTSAVLDRVGVEYHVTGGLASSYYGEPRFTQDIDLVVRLQPSSLPLLAEALAPEFLFDLASARNATARGGMFQALHLELLIKIDFHVGESVPGELSRSRRVALFDGLEVPLVSKEDALLSKLLWVKQGSGKSRPDIVGMLLDPTSFDTELIGRIAGDLDCTALWQELVEEAEKTRLG